MINTISEASARLVAEGLAVTPTQHPLGLQIAGTWRDGSGIQVSDNSCVIGLRDNRWVAGFPGRGSSGYEVSGSLEELVELVVAIYRHYRASECDFVRSIAEAIPHAEKYLIGINTAPRNEEQKIAV